LQERGKELCEKLSPNVDSKLTKGRNEVVPMGRAGAARPSAPVPLRTIFMVIDATRSENLVE